MPSSAALSAAISAGEYDGAFAQLYGEQAAGAQRGRWIDAIAAFEKEFGPNREVRLYSAPGRSEISGNHTDHNHGKVLAAAINLDIIGVAAKSDGGIFREKSKGYPINQISLADLSVQEKETGHSASLIRGVAARFFELGLSVGGVDLYTTSNVLKGSGLSSSAAYEVMIATVLSHEYNGGKVSPVEIAQICQYAENVYFGKPCGLLDQMTCSVGSFVNVDFANPLKPQINRISYDLSASGHALCIVNTGGNHADLTGDYAAVPAEMREVAACFGKQVLREVDEAEFFQSIGKLKDKVSHRSILRAIHFFSENRRVDNACAALKAGDFPLFLKQINESGQSSFMYNQNIYTPKAPAEQGVSLALALAQHFLGGEGACRVHGGGFAGTIQAFVPQERTVQFTRLMQSVFGENCCYLLGVRPYGGVMITKDL